MASTDDLPSRHVDEPDSPPVAAGAKPVDESEVSDSVGDFITNAADAVLSDATWKQAHDGNDRSLEAPSRQATSRRSGKSVQASPLLTWPRAKNPEAVALFVHGGDVTSNIATRRIDPAYLRMVPFARDLERRSRGRVGAAILRLAVRGWNDPDKPAIQDTRWALGELQRRYPGLPLGLAGHSMGGRVVLEMSNHQSLASLCALAPWASDEYAESRFTAAPLLIVHGKDDEVTDPKASADLVQRINAIDGQADFRQMPGGHTMLRRPNAWHAQASQFLSRTLLSPSGQAD